MGVVAFLLSWIAASALAFLLFVGPAEIRYHYKKWKG